MKSRGEGAITGHRQLSESRAEGGCYRTRLAAAVLFGVAFGYVESAIVVYLRALIYPDGFRFPLRIFSEQLLVIELCREAATLLMLLAVATAMGRRFWERFGYFCILFGVWDICYYVWLKITIDWPASLLDWDILFLIPLPWISPVIAPVLISIAMIVAGVGITNLYHRSGHLRAGVVTWVAGVVATLLILYSFMRDTGATLHQQMPQPYAHGLLIAGLVLYLVGYVVAYRRSA